jgi:lipopolysaccharide transport system ATP-binding protein
LAPNIQKPAIEITGLDIVYKVDMGLQSDLDNSISRLFGVDKGKRAKSVHLRALKDVNLTISENERVGIIGKNGAGKSSLLKAISGVLQPFSGKVQVTGIVQSLFDIGVGLEQTSSGRDNILFRGLVQGLEPRVIREREAEIVEFADLGRFIDMPISSYSTGMLVRLAFSISAFLEGNILLVDEIFAAGDLDFQEKASKKMHEIVARSGIFVFTSHNLSLISELCGRGIYLDKGKIRFDGPVDDAIDAYLKSANSNT